MKERRQYPRYPFIASAQLVGEESEIRVAGSISELSLGGCYVDMVDPFPTGAAVKIHITHGTAAFHAAGFVVYSHPGTGMGVAFRRLDPESRAVLEEWLRVSAEA
jgi:hypothetical protein